MLVIFIQTPPNARGMVDLHVMVEKQLISTRTQPRGPYMVHSISVNGEIHSVDADGDTPLLWVLRDHLHLTGTKFGCGAGFCGLAPYT
ncbi:MAG: hypothetical protein Ct9H300mP8_07810 [Gammaproteobacteria bacterium]|nr:MAG: hypothetical protein Ct9H300mP8_07810 [Gammaproteobacteria bacterium]